MIGVKRVSGQLEKEEDVDKERKFHLKSQSLVNSRILFLLLEIHKDGFSILLIFELL